MGQRQSSQQPSARNNNETNSNERSTRNGAVRPPSRVQNERTTARSQVIPLNENQRREERRLRREQQRSQQDLDELPVPSDQETNALLDTVSAALSAIDHGPQSSTENLSATVSPFTRMIASVISEAVMNSFRNGQIPITEEIQQQQQANVRQQLTMHLSPEVFQQMEPGSSEDIFMRFMRLPVIITSISTESATQENNAAATTSAPTTEMSHPSPTPTINTTTGPIGADGNTPTLSENAQISRVISMPIFLYGIRSAGPPATTTTTMTASSDTETSTNDENNNTSPIRRRSERIRARTETQAEAGQQQPSAAGQWTVYIISGSSVEGMMNDSPSYEELLALAALIGPARRQTANQEDIDIHAPKVKYIEVKETIVGDSDVCQICLSKYEVEDEVRVLPCHHGFCGGCIDNWLSKYKNQCPLCREQPIPTTSSDDEQ